VPNGAGGGGGDIAVSSELRVVAENPVPLPPLPENAKDVGRAGLRADISKDMLLGVPGVGEGGTLPHAAECPELVFADDRKAVDDVAV
jgi:hypothetical protein